MSCSVAQHPKRRPMTATEGRQRAGTARVLLPDYVGARGRLKDKSAGRK